MNRWGQLALPLVIVAFATGRLSSGDPPAAPLKPPGAKQPKKPILRLQTSQSPQAFRKGQPLIFEGLAAVSIHRPGPEHFKITRVSDGERISLRVDYDREQVEKRRPNQVRVRSMKVVFPYNHLFKGTRLFLYKDGIWDVKDSKGQAGLLDLYGCPELEPGVRYRLTWACWPVGAKQAVEVSCEFELKTDPKVTEIRLERSGGKESGPQDVLTLRADGSAVYEGKKNVERIGRYIGKLPRHGFSDSFPLLAEMYVSLGRQGGLAGKPTESVTKITLTVIRNSKAEEVEDWCPGIEERLWALEMAIRGVAADIRWEKAEGK